MLLLVCAAACGRDNPTASSAWKTPNGETVPISERSDLRLDVLDDELNDLVVRLPPGGCEGIPGCIPFGTETLISCARAWEEITPASVLDAQLPATTDVQIFNAHGLPVPVIRTEDGHVSSRMGRLTSRATVVTLRGLEAHGTEPIRLAWFHMPLINAHSAGFAYVKNTQGVNFVASVDRDSPASRAGIHPGDRVLAINGTDLATASREQVRAALHRPERRIRLQTCSGIAEYDLDMRPMVNEFAIECCTPGHCPNTSELATHPTDCTPGKEGTK